MNAVERRSIFDSVQNGQQDGASPVVDKTTESSARAEPTSTTGAASLDEANDLRPIANAPDLRAEANKGLSDPYAVIDRLKRGDLGPSRPLHVLATKEAALRVDAAALAELSRSPEFSPDALLLDQLTGTVDMGPINSWRRRKVERGAVDLYSALGPRDAIDSIRARTIVGLNNATMDCFERASKTGNLAAQNLNLRNGIKGAAVLGDLLQQYENRGRTSPPNVTVVEVNVEAGDQAIVETGDRRMSTREASVPRGASRGKN
jgi:hypothetical protein